MTERVTIQEVGLRDGLQLVKDVMPTAKKTSWIAAQSAAGFNAIEVTSFVPPKLLPQFADAAEVMKMANKTPNLTAAALALNLKGAVNALAAGTQKLTFVLSASEAHNHSNVRCTTDASLATFSEVVAHANNRDAAIGVAIATSFGCSLQGEVDEDRVVELAQSLEQAGACEITLADTVGYANPAQVKRLFSRVAARVSVPLTAHFHDTRGMGLANVVAVYFTKPGVLRIAALTFILPTVPLLETASPVAANPMVSALFRCLRSCSESTPREIMSPVVRVRFPVSQR